jgi:nitrite reductase (NADH) small subunit
VTRAKWIRVTTPENVPPREGRAVRIGDREIALFNLGDRFLAVDNRCPHKGGPLADGIIAGTTAVCPLHAWKINLETGRVERPSNEGACVLTYATRRDGDTILVEVPCPVLEPVDA